MDRDVFPGEARRPSDLLHLRRLDAAGLPGARRPIRELVPAGRGAACGAVVADRSSCGAQGPRPRQQTQIGLVLLIALSAKNAILIVEVARERRAFDGKPILEAALEAARVRFRPILMTSFAFILGVL